MPAITTVGLNDRAGTPVTHSFVPRSLKDGVAELVASSGVPIGEQRLTVSVKKTGKKYKVELRLLRPVVQTETINSIDRPTIVRSALGTLTFSYDETSTTQERDDITGMIRDALDKSKSFIDDIVVDLQSPY